MFLKRFSILASSLGLAMVVTNSAIAHPLSQSPPSFQPSSICGAQGVPYVARSFDQQVLGIRCLQLSDRVSEMDGSQMTWYGANQGREGSTCYQGSAMVTVQSPTTWYGDAIALKDPVPEVLNLEPQPFVLQVTQGQWPFPNQMQLRGRQQEVWVKLQVPSQSPQRWQSWLGSLQTCDRYFRQSRFDDHWGNYDWLTRPGSGWDWLWRNRR